MSAEVCATKIIKAMLNEEEELYVGGKELLIIKIRRFFPSLFSKLIRKQSPY
jgi:short-subunit dehydrogenase